MSTSAEPAFKVCITMAGAVSAGAYTAGVIDYLLETLHLWQRAKDKNNEIKEAYPDTYLDHGYDPSVPMHDVSLEVIGGASAGGITGSLTFMALSGGHAHLAGTKNEKNILYESWVTMADNGSGADTLEKLLSIDDIERSGEVESLLNTLPIEEIADKNLKTQPVNKFPPYAPEDLDLILTVSNLRGLKYKIIFTGSDEDAGNCITTHSGFFRYRTQNQQMKQGIPPGDDLLYYVLNLNEAEHEDIKGLKEATLSTAAFPIGLKCRKNTIPTDYLRRYQHHLFASNKGVRAIIPQEDIFQFTSVDGGLFNNEPFGYTLKTLKERHPAVTEKHNYAMIMIDPFPNYSADLDPFDEQSDVLSIGKRIFTALRNQALFKQDDIIDALDDTNDTRFLIAPARKVKDPKTGDWLRKPNALACGALAGFSGFLSKKFREHDFQLGRINAQSFLRYWFALGKTEARNKLNADITPEAFSRFAFSDPPRAENNPDAKFFFPIIPDMKVEKAFDNQYKEAELDFLPFPTISARDIENKYRKLALKRINKIRKSLVNRSLLNIALSLFSADKKIYEALMGEIQKGLEQHGLLKE